MQFIMPLMCGIVVVFFRKKGVFRKNCLSMWRLSLVTLLKLFMVVK